MPSETVNVEALDKLIQEARETRRHFSERYARTNNHGHSIEAWAAALREQALLDARKSIVGKIEPGFEFRCNPAWP